MLRLQLGRSIGVLALLSLMQGCVSSRRSGEPAKTGGDSAGGSAGERSQGGTSTGEPIGGTLAEGGTGRGGTAGGKATYTPPLGSGEPGEWSRIGTPAPVAWSVLNDPVRANDFYAFMNEGPPGKMHIIKSTDYGKSWTTVSKTDFDGDPWGAGIDPNRNRDPNLPPTMYTPAGQGKLGLWKSTDGGVIWTQLFPQQRDDSEASKVSQYWPPDLYAAHVIPDGDTPNHVVVTYHANGWSGGGAHGLLESFDGGKTWIVHRGPPDFGASQYMVILDAMTWLVVSQDGGIFKTSSAGRANGQPNPSAWKKVDDMAHFHGSMQAAVVNGVIYIPGQQGIKRSTDKGDTWTRVYDAGGGNWMSGVIATEKYLYADYMLGPSLLRSPIDDGKKWEKYCDTPGAMTNGSNDYGLAASTDGKRWYIISGNFTAGLWRYVEE